MLGFFCLFAINGLLAQETNAQHPSLASSNPSLASSNPSVESLNPSVESSTNRSHQFWRDSLARLNKEIQASPWSTDLHLRKAAVNIELNQWQYAIDEYTSILKRDSHNPAALFYRAYANTHLRRYPLAKSDYEELLSYFPRHFEARLSLSHVLQMMGKDKDAVNTLNLLLQQHPDSAVAYAARATLEGNMQQVPAAVFDWEKAIELSPGNVDYVASLASLLINANRHEEARKVLDKAVRTGIPRSSLSPWYSKLKKK